MPGQFLPHATPAAKSVGSTEHNPGHGLSDTMENATVNVTNCCVIDWPDVWAF